VGELEQQEMLELLEVIFGVIIKQLQNGMRYLLGIPGLIFMK
jgi:hypothetical protein